MSSERDFDYAVQKIQARQQRERLRALLAVLLPALLGAVFLAYGAWQLRDAERETAALRVQSEQYQQKAAALNKEVEAQAQKLQSLQTQLAETTHLARFVHPIDLIDQKMIYSTTPNVAPVLGTILQLRERNVPWHLGGTKPQQGFDSPSFAAYVLQQHGALPGGDGGETELLSRSRQLFDSLPKAEAPQPGDLVFYPSGYALFWFVDGSHRPFVIGMTPSGIVALNPDFAARTGLVRPQYRK